MLESILRQSGIRPAAPQSVKGKEDKKVISIDGDTVTIGSFKMTRGEVQRPEMLPSPKAVDIPCHVNAIQDLLEDWHNGERALLLLGNQGVGKNIIVDRICEIANWEREYIQLHRDSTIGQLTLTPTLENGRITWRDSPLVRAVRDGCALVVDEADKAPVEVVSVLKGLVEDGELLLADGRRISRHHDGPGFIKIHPNFSLWVIAKGGAFGFGRFNENGFQAWIVVPLSKYILKTVDHVHRQGMQGLGMIQRQNSQIARSRRKNFGSESHG
jgi:hypothetical protein